MTNRSSEAVPLLNTAIRIDPDTSTAFVILAMAYNQLRQFSKTISLLEGNLDWLGTIVEVHYHLGVAYAFRGDTAAARRELEIVSRFGDAPVMETELSRLLETKPSRGRVNERN
jgi:tetratricopeptide (TPR) repeat protein